MSANEQDRRIEEWLRGELDPIPEPTRAVQGAIDAAAITPQRRGRLYWLRQALGLDVSTTQQGRPDRPEVVLSAPSGSLQGEAGALRRQGTISLPAVFSVLLVAVVLGGATAWMTVGPGRELLGGSRTMGTIQAEQPLRPLDPPGPGRVIVVDPVEGHFSTIAGAIAAAQPGDLIELRPGTHQAEVVIDKDITIAGAGDREAIVVEPLPPTQGAGERDRLRDVFTLRDTDATLRGITVRGSDYGTAVVIDGGSPTLEDLVIDPRGDMRTSGPNQPRESITVTGGASPDVRASTLTSLSGVSDGSTPLFEDVQVQGGCLLIEGQDTSVTIRDVDFENSECPGFSVQVAHGAHALIEASPIISLPGNAGIRVANPGSSAEITGVVITGGSDGVYVSDAAEVTFNRSSVGSADVGVRVVGAVLELSLGRLDFNGTGLAVSGDSFLETTATDICQNDRNLDLRDGAFVPLEANRVCIDGSAELAAGPGA